jgi:hypothetical protein
MAVSAWRVAGLAPSPGGAVGPVGPGDQVVQAVGQVLDGTADAASVHTRRAAIEPAAAKRVEIERLVAVAAAATVLVLALAVAGLPRARPGRLRHPAVSDQRPRGPPLSFVS